MLFSTIGHGSVTIVDGTPAPAYPAAMPDPWIVAGTLTPNGTVAVTGTSSIRTGTLTLGGRVTVEGTASLSADTIEFRGTTGPTEPERTPAELFLSGGSATFGSSTPGMDTTAYLKVTDGGIFTLDGAGGMGGEGSVATPEVTSVVVISLDSGGKFEATGDQNFGGENSSFSLGPGGGDGDVLTAKQELADVWVSAATAGINVPGALAGTGSNTTFMIDGDVAVGGRASDARFFISDGSIFEVTGDLLLGGGSSTTDLLVVESSFKVDGAATFGDSIADTGSDTVTSFFGRASVEVGGTWVLGRGAATISSTTALDSDIDVGGSFVNLLGGGSVITTTIEGGSLTVGGDYHFGAEDDSAVAISIAGSNVNIGGDWLFSNGLSSIRTVILSGSSFDVSQSISLGVLSETEGFLRATHVISESDFKTGGSFPRRGQ